MSSLAIGFFDGVHLGHQAILKGADAVLTFRNHPLSVLAPANAPRLIMSCEERVAAIRARGVKDVTVLDFTPELAELSPESFVARYLSSPVSGLLFSVRCGENWRFGKGGEGNAEWLRARGVDVEVAPYAEHKGERISSSRIRASLEHGEIEDANAMLGRRFQVQGCRFKGKGVGEKIGYPTINLEISGRESGEVGESARIRLMCGVYEVEIDGAKGIANYGLAPTMGDRAWTSPVLELHVLGNRTIRAIEQSDNLSVSFVRFIRPERKFESVRDLQRQIAADCATIMS